MKEETLKAIELVGKVLILVPLLVSLVILLYFNITGRSAEIGSGFCVGTVILVGIVLVGYSAMRIRSRCCMISQIVSIPFGVYSLLIYNLTRRVPEKIRCIIPLCWQQVFTTPAAAGEGFQVTKITILSILRDLYLIANVFATSLVIRMGASRKEVFAFYFWFLISVGLAFLFLLPTGGSAEISPRGTGWFRFVELPILYSELALIPSAFCLVFQRVRTFLVFLPLPVVLGYAMDFTLTQL